MNRTVKKVLACAMTVSLAAGLCACTTYNNFKNAFLTTEKKHRKELLK